jgi:hypothetical protein
MPEVKESVRFLQQRLPDTLRVAATLRNLFELALEMSPAELMQHIRPKAVGAMAIGHEYAFYRTEQRFGRFGISSGLDPKAALSRCSNPRFPAEFVNGSLN